MVSEGRGGAIEGEAAGEHTRRLLSVFRNHEVPPKSVFLAVLGAEEFFFRRSIVFPLDRLKRCRLRALLDATNVGIGIGVKPGNYSFHYFLVVELSDPVVELEPD